LSKHKRAQSPLLSKDWRATRGKFVFGRKEGRAGLCSRTTRGPALGEKIQFNNTAREVALCVGKKPMQNTLSGSSGCSHSPGPEGPTVKDDEVRSLITTLQPKNNSPATPIQEKSRVEARVVPKWSKTLSASTYASSATYISFYPRELLTESTAFLYFWHWGDGTGRPGYCRTHPCTPNS